MTVFRASRSLLGQVYENGEKPKENVCFWDFLGSRRSSGAKVDQKVQKMSKKLPKLTEKLKKTLKKW